MGSVQFFGQTLGVHPEASAMAVIDLAAARVKMAAADNTENPEVVVAMFALVEDLVIPEDRARFRSLARSNRASFDDLSAIVTATVEADAERPTGPPSDSSDGPTATPDSSGSSAVDRVSAMFPGRPDKALAVLRSTRQSA